MKNLLLLLSLIIGLTSFSQTNTESEITAEGSSKTMVKPDLASLRITVVKENLVQKNAIKELNEEVEKLHKILLNIGFTGKHIKISDYSISSEENEDDKKEYTATNTLSIDFLLNNKILEAFYQGVQTENLKDMDIDFDTKISEELEKSISQQLVQKAIVEAKNNAENIAKALDVKIVNVKQVSKYNFRDLAYASYRVDEVAFKKPMMAPSPPTAFDKFEVEEIELNETITIVYEITKK
jgi:uncharacterized protein YggE